VAFRLKPSNKRSLAGTVLVGRGEDERDKKSPERLRSDLLRRKRKVSVVGGKCPSPGEKTLIQFRSEELFNPSESTGRPAKRAEVEDAPIELNKGEAEGGSHLHRYGRALLRVPVH